MLLIQMLLYAIATQAKIQLYRINKTWLLYLRDTALTYSLFTITTYVSPTLTKKQLAHASCTLGQLGIIIVEKHQNSFTQLCNYKACCLVRLRLQLQLQLPWYNYLIDAIVLVLYAVRYIHNDYNSGSSVTTMVDNLDWECLETRQIKAGLASYKCFSCMMLNCLVANCPIPSTCPNTFATTCYYRNLHQCHPKL